jgi:alkanesulfonate monooxygenase SsuD/methylene tetrahydromethanopterin reductase-like flavin-dependent oxidoreductase (luciferase family)
MDIGVFMTMPAPQPRPEREMLSRGLELAVEAEALGFSHVWLAEHHFTNYAYSSRPLLLLAHLAAHTHRIRLGTAIVPLSLHHPLIVAEELATLDVLSGGRAEAGFGKGYQQYQYERFGLLKGSCPERNDEALDIVQRALHEPLFEFDGRAFQIPRTRLYPRPLQARMPCWLVVNSSQRREVEQALQRRMNLFTGVLEPISQLTNLRERYPDLAPQFDMVRIGTQRPVYVAASDDEARAVIAQVRWNGRATWRLRHNVASVVDGVVHADPLPGELADDALRDDFAVIGTAEYCIRQLARIRDGIGCDYFSASFWFGALSQEQVLASMRRFALHVMPAFVGASAGASRASTC